MPRPPAAAPFPLAAGLLLAGSLLTGGFDRGADGQEPRNRRAPALADTPAGAVGARAVLLDPARRGFQTVRVTANGGGTVEVYGSPYAPPIPVPPTAGAEEDPGALVRLCVGKTYRMRLTDVPGLPAGTTLFPSVELIDRLHPPDGLASAFPLPVSLTEREAELAAGGALLTKVIYLEDPDLAPTTRFTGPLRRTDLPPGEDPLAAGDARGRVIAVVRVGGRVPDPRRPEPAFYGTGGPVLPAAPADVNLPPLPPVTGAFGKGAFGPGAVTPASATQIAGCPADCPPGCPPPGRATLDPCPPAPAGPVLHEPVLCPRGGVAVGVRPPVSGAVLDWRLPGPYCPPEVRPKDEYLCDGGDRRRPAGTTLELGGLGGLDPEDAVVRFRGSDGELRVCPTNRVCVYAPRFAEVRTILGTVADTRYYGPADLARTARSSVRVVDIPTGTVRQDVRPDAARARSRAGGLIADKPWSALSDVIRRQQNVRYVETLRVITNDRANLRAGLTSAELAARLDAAATWTRADNPVTFFVGAAPNEAVNSVRPRVMVGVEDKSKPGLLCVNKYADRAFAAPGDIVTFTIVVENRGEKPLTDVAILDNLTPRLEYVENSGESTLPGRIEVTPNGEGSGIVRFVLANPLAGGERGELTFQTRVR